MSKEAIKYTSNFANGELGKIGIWSLQTDKLYQEIILILMMKINIIVM